MPLSRLVFSAARNKSEASLQSFRRFGASQKFFSSIYSKPNVSPYSLTGKIPARDNEILSFFKNFHRFGPSKNYCSSSTRSGNNIKRPVSVPEHAETRSSAMTTLVVPLFALAGIGGLVYFIHSNDERRSVQQGQGEKYERSSNQGPIIGGPFSLINSEGQLVTEKNFVGNWVLLYFGYTSSPDVGPAEVQKMAKSVDILESKQNLKVLPMFVTIDPQRDTPSHLRAYLREFDSRIVGLTGPDSAIRQMAQEYRVFFRRVGEEGDDYLVETSNNMYLMNPNMQIVKSFGVHYNAEELVEEIIKETKKTLK